MYGPRKYSKFMFYSSFSMLVAAFISYIMNDIYITSYFFILFLTSINHWRRPEYGMRRNIDLLMVYLGLFIILFQICLLKSELNRYCLASLILCCIIFYTIEHILAYYNNVKWIIFHMTIHIYASCCVICVLFN